MLTVLAIIDIKTAGSTSPEATKWTTLPTSCLTRPVRGTAGRQNVASLPDIAPGILGLLGDPFAALICNFKACC